MPQQPVETPETIVILSGAIVGLAVLVEVARRITRSAPATYVKDSLHPPHVTLRDEVFIVALIRNLLYRIGAFARGTAT